MEISIVSKNGENDVEDESVRDEPVNPSSSFHSSGNHRNRSDHDKSVSTSGEGDNGAIKKNDSSGTRKKVRKSPKKKSSTKAFTRRKKVTEDANNSDPLIGRSVHSALNRSIDNPTTRIKTRRQSMGSINKDSSTFEIKSSEIPSPAIIEMNSLVEHSRRGNGDDSNSSKTSDCEDSDIDSVQSHTRTTSTKNEPSSSRTFETLQSQKNMSLNSSSRSLRSHSTRSLRSHSTQNNRSRPSSSRSLLSNAKSLNPSSHSYAGRNVDDGDVRNASFDTDDFKSDLEEDTEIKCSVDAVSSDIDNVKKDEVSAEASPPQDRNSSRGKDSSRSQERSREGRNDNRVQDSKQRKSRHHQLSQTDELGRGSNHNKLEGVYLNEKPESKNQVAKKNQSDVEEEVMQILTKLSSDSNDQESRKRTSSKPRFRYRRRSSMGAGEDQLATTRSRSREQVSTRKDFSRIRSASSEKRVKRGPSTNIITPKSQETVKTLFGSDALSKENSNSETILDLKAPIETFTASEDRSSSKSSSKVEEETSPTETENTTFDDQHTLNESIQDTAEDSTKDKERRQRRRSSMGRTMRKDRISTQSRQAEKRVSGSDAPALQEVPFHSETEVKNATSDGQPSSEAKASATKTTEIENNKIDPKPRELERKQRRRSSMGRTMRKDRVSTPSQVTEKEFSELNILKLQDDPNISTKNIDQKSNSEAEKRSPYDLGLPNVSTKDPTAEESLANIDVTRKGLERKQRRRGSMGRTMRKDRISTPSQVAEKESHGSSIPKLEENPNITTKNSDQKSKTEIENEASDELCSSNTSTQGVIKEESLAYIEYDSKKIDLRPKDVERKQRRRSSMGRTMRKDRVSTPQEGEEKLIKSTTTPKNEDQVVVERIDDQNSVSEPENVTSESRQSSNSLSKNATAEGSMANLENGTMKLNSASEDFDKKQRRRSNSGKPTRKDRNSSRIAGKSGHKISRKSTRERKRRDSSKNHDYSEEFASDEFTSEESASEKIASEEFASEEFASEEFASDEYMAEIDEANVYMKNDSTGSTKNRSSTRKEKTSTRKEKRNRKKDLLPTETTRKPESDTDPMVHTSTTEPNAEGGEFSERLKVDVATPSLSDLFSNTEHNAKEAKGINSNFAPSLCSNESEEKDDEESDEDNYLQLTFVAESGVGTDDLFALMDEQLNQSFSNDMDASKAEAGDRNTSIRSFVSFTNEIDLKVSTTSYSLSRNVQDGDDPAIETFHCNHAMFRNETGEEIRTIMKKTSTPTPRRKKLTSPSFGLSKSLHAAPFGDSGFVNGIEEPPSKPQKRGMLRKMRKGFTEGSKLTFHKAASTRNLLGQATTKVLARRKEEAQGLLSNGSN